jgi:hypothetical protein
LRFEFGEIGEDAGFEVSHRNRVIG